MSHTHRQVPNLEAQILKNKIYTDNKLLTSIDILLINKQGQTSMVSNP